MSDQQDSAAAAASAGANSSSSTPSVQQLKTRIANKLQANRPLVLKLHSILSWEQDIYPIVVVAFVSFSFLLIHLLNSSILTTLSYLGIALALFDLAMPFITKNFLSQPLPKGASQEKDNQRFDKICQDLAKAYVFLRTLCDSCCSLKTKKPKLYYPSILGALLVLAYIGSKFNNLFLTYVTTLFVAMYPGLDKRGIPQKAVEFVFAKLGRRPPAFLQSAPSASSGDRRSSGKRN